MKLRLLNITWPLLSSKASVSQFTGQLGASSVSPPGPRAFFRPRSPGSPTLVPLQPHARPPGSPTLIPPGEPHTRPPAAPRSSPRSPPLPCPGWSLEPLACPAGCTPAGRREVVASVRAPGRLWNERRDAAFPGSRTGRSPPPPDRPASAQTLPHTRLFRSRRRSPSLTTEASFLSL